MPHGVELPQLGAEVLESEAGLCLTQLAGRQQLLHTQIFSRSSSHGTGRTEHVSSFNSMLQSTSSNRVFWEVTFGKSAEDGIIGEKDFTYEEFF